MVIGFDSMRIHLHGVPVIAMALLAAATAPAAAQSDIRRAEEPTAGVHLPVAPLAGEPDAFSLVTNPAGLRFLRGFHAGIGIELEDPDDLGDPSAAADPAGGLGIFAAGTLGGGLLPAIGLGAGVELLRPAGDTLAPDPGSPTRFTLGAAVGLGAHAALGLSWHRFVDDPGRVTSGLDSLDLGLSARLGARWAAGAVVRDLNAPSASDGAGAALPVPRRYELELVTRPTGTDRLELALGGRIDEEHADLDGWLRWSLRLVRGLYFEGQASTRALRLVDASMPAAAATEDRDYRVTAGLALSFGSVGAGFYGTGARGPDGSSRFAGGALTVRASSEQVPSVLGRTRRIERLELSGALEGRALAATLLRLRALARDPSVVAVVVRIDDLGAGWATAQELRQGLASLRKAGKRVFAFLTAGTTREYFLASAADRIYVDPAGGLRLVGMAGTTVYYKGTFDKLGVAAEFVKIEEYKSAPEAWTRTGPTEPAERMRNEIYDSLFASVVDAIAQGRSLDASTVRALIDAGPYTAGDLTQGPAKVLVDAIATPDEAAAHILSELGAVFPVAETPRERPASWALPGIAVITIEGDIVDGESSNVPLLGRKLVGGETISKAIAAARASGRVAAIVLRIDSPGGSALASEVMAREVFATRGVKPIICSMGDVAASGGYYAAAGCDLIFAEPTTITGSIGIFYGKFDLSRLLDKLGLSWHAYKRGARADLDSYFQPYSDEDRALVKEKMRYLYERFLDAVARGRNMDRDQVDAVGRGRVWSGVRAREVGLVDRLGGLTDAIAEAKQRAGLDDDTQARVVWLPEQRAGLVQQLLGLSAAAGLAGDDGAGLTAGWAAQGTRQLAWPPGLRELVRALPASLWAQPDAPQARLPFEIVWD